MKFKIFYTSPPKNVKEIKTTLEDFCENYMKTFEDKKKQKVMGFKVTIEPIKPILISEKDGIIVDIKIDIPKWVGFMIKKGDWVKYFKELLGGRKLNFKDIKYIGE